MATVRVNHRKKSTNTRSKQRSTWNDKQCKETRFYIFNKRLMLLVMIFEIQQTNSIHLVFVFEFYFHLSLNNLYNFLWAEIFPLSFGAVFIIFFRTFFTPPRQNTAIVSLYILYFLIFVTVYFKIIFATWNLFGLSLLLSFIFAFSKNAWYLWSYYFREACHLWSVFDCYHFGTLLSWYLLYIPNWNYGIWLFSSGFLSLSLLFFLL